MGIPETRVLGTRSTMEKWDEGMLNKAFHHFLPIFATYLLIFQSVERQMHWKALKNHQIWLKFG